MAAPSCLPSGGRLDSTRPRRQRCVVSPTPCCLTDLPGARCRSPRPVHLRGASRWRAISPRGHIQDPGPAHRPAAPSPRVHRAKRGTFHAGTYARGNRRKGARRRHHRPARYVARVRRGQLRGRQLRGRTRRSPARPRRTMVPGARGAVRSPSLLHWSVSRAASAAAAQHGISRHRLQADVSQLVMASMPMVVLWYESSRVDPRRPV